MASHLQRRDILKLTFGSVLAVFLPFGTAKADSVNVLNNFLQNVTSLKANFTQVVTSSQNGRTRTSSGTFILSRPNKFRFDYLEPYEQQIVSDGVTLWLYDPDLEQVTERDYNSAIDSTPAALLAGGAQATMEQENFTLTSLPDSQGLQWIEGLPRQDDGQIRSARVGFKEQILAVLEITDNFGQTSTLTFSDVEINPAIADEVFAFEVPEGADVISQ